MRNDLPTAVDPGIHPEPIPMVEENFLVYTETDNVAPGYRKFVLQYTLTPGKRIYYMQGAMDPNAHGPFANEIFILVEDAGSAPVIANEICIGSKALSDTTENFPEFYIKIFEFEGTGNSIDLNAIASTKTPKVRKITYATSTQSNQSGGGIPGHRPAISKGGMKPLPDKKEDNLKRNNLKNNNKK